MTGSRRRSIKRLDRLERTQDGLIQGMVGFEAKIGRRFDEVEHKIDDLKETMDERFSHLAANLIKSGAIGPEDVAAG